MKSLPIFPSAKLRRAPGFTLVEMLVSIAVLGILVLVLAQISGIMNSAWLYGQGKVNNFTKARAMLNLLENDLHALVLRPDLAAFPVVNGVTQCEFYTARAGIPANSAGSLRNISLVQYAILNGTTDSLPTSTLERFDMPVLWGDSATNLAFGNTSGFASTAGAATETLKGRDTAPGVVAFQVLFVASNGSFSTTTFTPLLSASGATNTGTNGTLFPTRGIGVTIAVIDDQAMRLLNSTQLTNLQSGFVGAVTGAKSVKADWEHFLNTGVTWTNYPKNLSTGIVIYECYISIP